MENEVIATGANENEVIATEANTVKYYTDQECNKRTAMGTAIGMAAGAVVGALAVIGTIKLVQIRANKKAMAAVEAAQAAEAAASQHSAEEPNNEVIDNE